MGRVIVLSAPIAEGGIDNCNTFGLGSSRIKVGEIVASTANGPVAESFGVIAVYPSVNRIMQKAIVYTGATWNTYTRVNLNKWGNGNDWSAWLQENN